MAATRITIENNHPAIIDRRRSTRSSGELPNDGRQTTPHRDGGEFRVHVAWRIVASVVVGCTVKRKSPFATAATVTPNTERA